MHLVELLVVEEKQYQSEDDVAERLIEHGRVLGERVSRTLEHYAPRKVGVVAVDLGVEEIAKADARSCKADDDHQLVEYPQQVEAFFLTVFGRIPPHCEDDTDGASVAGESALPGHEHFLETLPGAEIVRGIVEGAVAEACTDDHRNQHRVEKRVEQGLADTLPTVETPHYIPAEYEAGHEKQGVPADTQRADVEKNRIYVPVYCKNINHIVLIVRTTNITKNHYLWRRFPRARA